MRNLGFDREPSEEVLERLANPHRAVIVDPDHLKGYIRRRLREECISLERLSDSIGISKGTAKNFGAKNQKVSLPILELALYVVDGTTIRYFESWAEELH